MKNKKANGLILIHLLAFSIYNLGHPVTPEFINEVHAPEYMTGLLLGTMALAQFFFAPVWGQISDQVGRKIAFIGPLGYAIGQLGFVLLNNAGSLVFFRFIAGAFAITSVVHFAYLADITSGGERTKYLGAAALLTPVGTFFGYTIGGIVGDMYGPRASFILQIILCLILSLIIYLFMDPFKRRARQKKIRLTIFNEQFSVMKHSSLLFRTILIITFLNIISYQLTVTQAAVILNNGFHESLSFIGLFIALFNLVGGLLSYFAQRSLFNSKRSNNVYLPYLSLVSIVSSGVALLSAVYGIQLMWVGLMLSTMLNTIFVALIQDTIIITSPQKESGKLLGVNQGIQSLGTFVGSASAGIFVSLNMFLPFLMGMIMFAFTFVVNKFILAREIKEKVKTE